MNTCETNKYLYDGMPSEKQKRTLDERKERFQASFNKQRNIPHIPFSEL